MKIIRYALLSSGVVFLIMALGFIFRLSFATSLWPWQDGRLSYLFIGSILAAVSVAALWIGWRNDLGVLPAGTLNVFVIAFGCAIYFFRIHLASFGLLSILFALLSGLAFLWSSGISPHPSFSTPAPIRVSFGIFVAVLLLAGTMLIFKQPIFPWKLNPDSSVVFGCIFIGDAFYFLHALFKPQWNNAAGQLLSFLAYDLVLIGPFSGLFKTVDPTLRLNLILYIVVLIFSGVLAIYYLFINSRTRNWLSVN